MLDDFGLIVLEIQLESSWYSKELPRETSKAEKGKGWKVDITMTAESFRVWLWMLKFGPRLEAPFEADFTLFTITLWKVSWVSLSQSFFLVLYYNCLELCFWVNHIESGWV